MSDASPASPPRLHALAEAIGRFAPLDEPAEKLAKAVRSNLDPGPVKDALSGTWLGHPAHPLMTDVVIGTWTSALLLDVIGGREAQGGAKKLIGVGLLAALPTAAAGLSDWADSTPGYPGIRRLGFAHLLSNDVAIGLFGASFAARRRGRSGKALAAAGAAFLTVGGFIGAHLTYAKGVGVQQNAFDPGPDGWVAALPADQLPEGAKVCVEVEGSPIFLTRQNGVVSALHNRCNHRGGPLSDGDIVDRCIECPWHGSRFRLEDGAVERGPATAPQSAFDSREADGQIQLKRRG